MKTIIDTLFTIGLFINALLFIPQALKLYRLKKSDHVSLLTFVGFNIIQILSIINGFYYHNPALIYGFIPSLITCGLVVYLTIFYRLKRRGR